MKQVSILAYLQSVSQKTSPRLKMEKMSIAALFAFFAILGAAETSFITKNNNGLERLVISIEDHLALPPTSSLSSSASGQTTTGYKGATQECQIVLEKLKVMIISFSCK